MIENSKLSRYSAGKILECFCADIDAGKTASLLKLSKRIVDRHFSTYRVLINAHQLSKKKQMLGVGKGDETLVVPVSSNGSPAPCQKSQGTRKQSVFGIYERDGLIFTEQVTACLAKTLRAVNRGKASPESIFHSDGWRGYDGLADIKHDKHFRIAKGKGLAETSAHISGVEAFWNFAQQRLAKLAGAKRNFELHLKECEWRFDRTLPQLLTSLKGLLRNKDSTQPEGKKI